MSIGTDNLHQQCTHWAYTGSDGFGGYQFGNPTLLDCRWVEGEDLQDDTDGREKVSRSMVYLGVDVIEGDYLAEGDYTETTDPLTLTNIAYRVDRFQRTTSLRNLHIVRKATL